MKKNSTSIKITQGKGMMPGMPMMKKMGKKMKKKGKMKKK